MTARIRGPLAAACLIALTFAAAPGTGTGIGAHTAIAAADATSTVGWVRLAYLSTGGSAIDWYVYPSGSTNARMVVKDVAFGTFSPYASLAPGNYLVAARAAGNASTGNPLTTAQVAVAAGQAYTVAGLGAVPVPMLRVLSDKLGTTQGKAGVRVFEASQRNPAVSVSAGGVTIATNVQYPNVTDYQPVAAGASTIRVSTQTAGASATMRANFAVGSTYTVVVLDGSGSAPRILDLSDASGVGVPPKGGVNTGLGGTATQGAGASSGPGPGPGSRSGSGGVFPAYSVVLLIIAGGAVPFGMSRRRKANKRGIQ